MTFQGMGIPFNELQQSCQTPVGLILSMCVLDLYLVIYISNMMALLRFVQYFELIEQD